MIAAEGSAEEFFVNVVDGVLQSIEHSLAALADKARNPNRIE